MSRRRLALLALLLGGVATVAWEASSATQAPVASPRPPAGIAAVTTPRAAAPPGVVAQETPMAERVAVLGVLNKRDGLTRDISLHPGQAARFGGLVVRLRACETTADWEPEQLTGAFVQADVRGPDGGWRRVFSGWLYKESPGLNVVPSALYDVWPKSCTMRHPDTGPDTVSATDVASAGAAPRRSIAKKSADEPAPGDDAVPSPSALSNSAT